ncbi:mevalonate kinase [Saprospira sp. CCB-QB6]|uniref:GHMP family kinase ATP-binding protein n=1 Tax=Saprospira sp. CCB-QB6 TaxID=3023936 RepID=UPI00234B3E74|nr:mevalonate kinase [Saprospira sp. CCB-QB6]WCL80418.1 mevalonate kinase [Saprospira sp. CCB-QB6]
MSTAYPAKLLLFGEYSIMQAAPALALPFWAYRADWSWKPSVDRASSQKGLRLLLESMAPNCCLDLGRLEQDLLDGIWLQSNIPHGYGLGSSGSLVAAVYERYGKGKKARGEELILTLAQIETAFHGQSSGIDPLVSYLRKGLFWQDGQSEILGQEIRLGESDRGQLFLLNTKIARQTAPLVQHYLQACAQADFPLVEQEALALAHREASLAFLGQEEGPLAQAFGKISASQYQFFQRMIPDQFKAIWQKGLEGSSYLLKLCGAGGGGFLLGYSNNWGETQRELGAFELLPLVLEDI